MNNLDWQHWQYFLHIAQAGSLNRAADTLGVSQPTLSRHLHTLEKQLGQTLFDRSTQGLSPTRFGQSLIEEAEQMRTSAQRLERLAAGQDQAVTGRVRLSANEPIALHYLPRILPDFMDANPALSVEVEVTNKATSLDKRDADVAIRMFPPQQPDLIARHLFDIPLGFYASARYFAKHGNPTTAEALFQHRLLGYDRDKQFENGAAELGWPVRNEDFYFRTDNMALHLEMARHGGGIVGTHQQLAASLGLVSVEVEITLPKLPLYLCCHRDVKHNRRIRLLMDFLAEHLDCFPDRAGTLSSL
ncbi:LysR family transcriptional regulator [Saccharospirillum alexandrii]|uniref:LysR family transcriptional regulator n=1 Tax=Saccharospirillum alexandrii TaxID=2448477 RepID=UPI000FDB2302|nr:LysR family transcriptional regulator [Saccharospirillum alexandrii]